MCRNHFSSNDGAPAYGVLTGRSLATLALICSFIQCTKHLGSNEKTRDPRRVPRQLVSPQRHLAQWSLLHLRPPQRGALRLKSLLIQLEADQVHKRLTQRKGYRPCLLQSLQLDNIPILETVGFGLKQFQERRTSSSDLCAYRSTFSNEGLLLCISRTI